LIIFAPKHQVKHFSDFRLKFDGTVLSDVSCVNNLGVSRDKNRRDRVIFPFLGDKTCCTVLYTL
jgi:hypothetical protein